MDFYDFMDSTPLKRRFCTDYRIPMSVCDNPYFTKRLAAVMATPFHGEVGDALTNYLLMLEDFKDEEEYFNYYYDCKQKIIDMLNANEHFQRFNEQNFPAPSINIPSGESKLYRSDNDGKRFISIDMAQANFNALRHYDERIFEIDGDICDTWEKYSMRVFKYKYLAKSKYIRQVIFGACNPKKQIKYESYLMDSLLADVLEETPDLRSYIHSRTADEIIINIPKSKPMPVKANFLSHARELEIPIHEEEFSLYALDGMDAYMKIPETNGRKSEDGRRLKCVSEQVYHQVLLYYINGHLIKDDDLVFYYGGKLVRYLTPIADPFYHLHEHAPHSDDSLTRLDRFEKYMGKLSID